LKIAIIAPADMTVLSIREYLPPVVTEIITGGAKNVEKAANEYASTRGVKLTGLLQNGKKHGRSTLFRQYIAAVKYADMALIFWDGKCAKTKFIIGKCGKIGIPLRVIV